jgi:hypothetical protein
MSARSRCERSCRIVSPLHIADCDNANVIVNLTYQAVLPFGDLTIG